MVTSSLTVIRTTVAAAIILLAGPSIQTRVGYQDLSPFSENARCLFCS